MADEKVDQWVCSRVHLTETQLVVIQEADHLVSPCQLEVQAGTWVKAHVAELHKKGIAEGKAVVTDQKEEVV